MDSSDLKGKLNSKVFGTDLSAVAATYIHWRLPCLGSRVAVTGENDKGGRQQNA